MAVSQNGWPVLGPEEIKSYELVGVDVVLPLAKGPAGLVLAYWAQWYHDNVERLGKQRDDWGYAVRPVTGGTEPSNHASGTGEDLNAIQHPYGVATNRTFTKKQQRMIRRKLRFLRHVIRWGGDYQTTPDGMHFELDKGRDAVRRLWRVLAVTPTGRKIRKAN